MSAKKYFWTPDQDEIIRKRYDSRTQTITQLAERFNFPRWVICRRAAELGVARCKEPFWSTADEAFLERNYPKRSIRFIAKKLGRTLTAVALKKKRLGITKTMEGYTLRGVCEGLGVDHHKVERWIRMGWLKVRGRGVDRPQGDYKYFTETRLRNFIRSHPDEIDLRRVDRLWFIDLLAGIKTTVSDFEGVPDGDELAEVIND
jgi:hypothetical protein